MDRLPNMVVDPPQPLTQNNNDAKNTDIEMGDMSPKHDASSIVVPSSEQAELSWHDVTYTVINKRDKSPLTILNKVSGVVKPGELLGVMGPSGCGKSTLLDFLADRISSGTREGSVLVNGRPRGPSYKHIAKYVPQEDNLVGTMTVYETLQFSAELSLPESVPSAVKKARLEDVIQELGLSGNAHAPIGTVFTKGISGGQKRRVSIGIELLAQPKILFLDEPTSGLDSEAALAVVGLLRRLAREGHTVICTIHQPSSEVFHMLDRVLLLSRGETVFFGPTDSIVPYFASVGKQCPPYSNPSDFMMSIVNTDFESAENRDVRVKEVKALAANFKSSALCQELDQELQASKVVAPVQESAPTHAYTVSFLKQFIELSKRAWLDNLRNPGIFWVRIVMYIMLSLMIGTMYLGIGHGQRSINDRVSILFFIAAFMVFMSISAIPMFISERAVFLRERANGWYNVAAYVLANTVCGVPGLFMIALISSVTIYFMVGLNSDQGRFGIFLLDLFLSLWCAESLMLVISAVVPMYIIGMALGAGIFGMFMLCEGFFVIPDNIPPYWIWGYYIGFHTYSFEMFMYNEFNGLRIDCDRPIGSSGLCQYNSGADVLSLYKMENTRIWVDIVVIIAMMLIYRIIFYMILQFVHKGKR